MSEPLHQPVVPAEAVAIVGLSVRVPGAGDARRFWENLCAGRESIARFTAEDLAAEGLDPAIMEEPGYVNAGGALDGVELFDAAFFGYTPREADVIDPQHRVFLECAWEALEDAGCDPERHPGLIGVFAGTGHNDYAERVAAHRELASLLGGFQVAISNEKDHLTTRIGYKLDLRGPCVTVQTACSTSLVAVALACESLLGGRCDVALAGGVSIGLPQRAGYFYQEGGILSPDGCCRAFDAAAHGAVGGNGAGVVVLKRLSDALADGDSIRAVIKGAAINNDGAQKVGYTAPSVAGQAEVIAMAQEAAGVDPASIGYVEAHGTGTPLGDPIEVAALTDAFRAGTARTGFCALGSVKTNVGHLDAAAGVAGLVKAVLALEHRAIPPSLHFRKPNPKLDLAASPFYVNAELAQWPADDGPRRAGVSSFGIGGTNAHVVLEEAPAPAAASASRPWQLLTLSAKTPAALERATADLAVALARPGLDVLDVADAAYTLHVGRRQLPERRVVVCRDAADAAAVLSGAEPGRLWTASGAPRSRPVVFMFPGQGAQHPGMGADLYRVEPAYREAVDRCAELLAPELGLDLRELLDPPPGTAGAAERLRATEIAQPALFTVEYALARLLMEWGVEPAAMIGHSLGEYVAACLAGVLTLEDALALVAARGRLVGELPAGAMLAVPLPEAEVTALLGPGLALAAVNAPALCAVSGPEEEVERLAARLAAEGVDATRLHTSHAFHSAMVEPAVGELAALVRQVRLAPPRIPYLSNLTGGWATADSATDPHAWGQHLRRTVRFADGLAELLADPDAVLLEVGPGRTLSTFARRQAVDGRDGQVVLATLPHPKDAQPELPSLLAAFGRLWLAGVPVDWAGFHARERRRRVSLPTYPFERQRHWVDPVAASAGASRSRAVGKVVKRPEIADWFWAPVWRRTPPPGAGGLRAPVPGPWLIFLDRGGLGAALAERLRREGCRVATVVPGDRFAQRGEGAWEVGLEQRGDVEALIDELRWRGLAPTRVVHLWGTGPPVRNVSFDRAQDLGFYSVLSLVQALGRRGSAAPVRLDVVTSDVHEVVGGDARCPERATALGLVKVAPQELTALTCRAIDLALAGGAHAADLVDALWAELAGAGAEPSGSNTEPAVAWRNGHRWAQGFEPLPLAAPGAPRLRPGGVYLITGGLGAMGTALAEHLARAAGARLVLCGRTPLPPRREWRRWLAEHPEGDRGDRVGGILRRVLAIEAAGGEVLAASVDVADARALRALVRRARRRFGALHGVVHAAGATEAEAFRPLAELDRDGCERQLRPKARGLLALDRALAAELGGEPLDVCLLASSLSAVLGGLGFAAYAAANSYMDAFAAARRRPGLPWLAVDWDGWRFRAGDGARTSLAELAIEPAEGMAAFERLIGTAGLAQVAVSTGDLETRLEQWIGLAALRAPQPEAAPAALHARPALSSAYAAPGDEVETAIAGLWRQLLGVAEVGVHDDFFELGGHSLLAIQLVSRLRDRFGVEIAVDRVFEVSTVARLAREVAAAMEAGREEAERLERMVDLVERLSEAELEALLAQGEEPA